MNFDSLGEFDKLYLSSHYCKNTVTGKKSAEDFSEMVEELRKANNKEHDGDPWEELDKECRRQYEQDRRERKAAEAERRQVARERAAKRKKLLEYMQFLKQTSIKRADEEREMIAKNNKKNINNTRYRPKIIYVPVSYTGCTGDEDDDIFTINI